MYQFCRLPVAVTSARHWVMYQYKLTRVYRDSLGVVASAFVSEGHMVKSTPKTSKCNTCIIGHAN